MSKNVCTSDYQLTFVGLLSLLRRAASMANTQRRLTPSPTDLNYAFLMENIHTYSLEDEMARWPSPPHLHPVKGSFPTILLLTVEPPNQSLLPSPVNEKIYSRAILPPELRPAANTPDYIPPYFPKFPPKYTYAFTPAYPPRAIDPETIRKKAVAERQVVEESLAKLVAKEESSKPREMQNGKSELEGRELREEVWWETWREMGCDLDMGAKEVWPVIKNRRAGMSSL